MKNSKAYLIIIFLIIVGIICALVYKYCNDNYVEEVIIKKEEDKEKIVEEIEEKIIEPVYYYVDIKGAVNIPNVYKVEENSRIIDVINMAGGLKENADTSIVNLSKKVEDEMFIVIYTIEELQKYKQQNILVSDIKKQIEEDIIVDENNDAFIEKELTKEENVLININIATKEQLLTISGIGDSKAESIIKYREENGNFKIIDDIKNVSGIGESLFESIKEYITV